ncbi:MAG: hypothetical protein U0556_09885 [Dehalococcoidia bacterium]
MPLDLAKQREKTKSLTFDWDGEAVTLTYRVHTLTARRMARLDELAAASSQGAAAVGLIEMFCAIVAGWDVMQGDEPLPIDETTLLDVDIPFLNACFDAIRQDRRPDPPTPNNSAAT